MKENTGREHILSHDMRAMEENSEYFGLARLQLMENAGCSVAQEITSRWNANTSIVIFCGLGGNGGDGFVIARHLASQGFKSKIILAGNSRNISNPTALKNLEILRFLEEMVTIQEVHDTSQVSDIQADVVVDALLGIGTKGRLRPPILQMVKRINKMKSFRIAVDIPTGINADTGEVQGDAVKADLTITFYKTKKGFQNAQKYVGEVIVKDVGLPQQFERIAGPGDVKLVFRPRLFNAHKGDLGRLLIIGGNQTYIGAPALAALAALRTGVDLTYIGTTEKTAYAISSMSPDLITLKLPGNHLGPKHVLTIKEQIKRVDALIIGPGLGTHSDTKQFFQSTIEIVEKMKKPLLLDADGLKIYSENIKRFKTPAVLTPHTKEFEILTGISMPRALAEKVKIVNKTALNLNATILLKGPIDIISNGNKQKMNFTGNPGMTVGGTGDVLAGIIGALLAQGKSSFRATIAGAFINGFAGDLVSRKKGHHMIATDLIEQIPNVLKKIVGESKVAKTSE